MRDWLLTLALCACSKDASAPSRAPGEPAEAAQRSTASITISGAAAPRHFTDLASALIAIIPDDARVIGFGELHTRADRTPAAPAASTLASVTRALPAFAAKLSDLVIETWLVDPSCGAPAVEATERIEVAVERPKATKSEIAVLADAARAAGVQPHAMTLRCADYAVVAPAGGAVDPIAMLTLTTRELSRIVTSAVRHRDAEPGHRPWIAVYGGALHNDRFPDAGVAEWSYAGDADRASAGHFVEIDVIVPELAAGDPVLAREPWFALAGAPRDPARPVTVWTRGDRSFVVLLPPGAPPSPAGSAAPAPGAAARP